ncbi:MAG: PIG-L family deacetylase [Thermoplasmata archaeon]
MKILIISAHADDACVAIGGTIAMMAEDKSNKMRFISFSIAEKSVPKGFPKDVVAGECIEAMKVLGIGKKDIVMKRYPVRDFLEYRQEILEYLIKERNEFKPDMVIFPATNDVHQDHEVVNKECVRAFRRCSSLYGYDFPWNVLCGGNLNLFYEIKEKHLRKKIEALKCFESQCAKGSMILDEEYTRSLVIERGHRVGVRYAEALEMIREIRHCD